MKKLAFIGLWGALAAAVIIKDSEPSARFDFYPAAHTAGASDSIASPGSAVIHAPSPQDEEEQAYYADISTGVIGVTAADPADDPADNIFHIRLPELPAHTTATLQYELFGIADASGVARSINDNQATGGQFVTLHRDWTVQKENIPVSSLKSGDNIIRFGIPGNAAFYYRVKNIRITLRRNEKGKSEVLINPSGAQIINDKIYLRGIIQMPGSQEAPASLQLICNGQPVPVMGNEFEAVIPHDKNNQALLVVKAILPDGTILTKTINPLTNRQADYEFDLLHSKGIKAEGYFNPGHELLLQLPQAGAALHIPQQALASSRQFSITALRDVDMALPSADLVNVTAGAAGYRFLPHGSQFSSNVSVSIPYDSTLFPEGYTAADIRTFFFNEATREWTSLPVDTLLTDQHTLVSGTAHFTDMINGIIKVPESPQTQGYKPTSIKDIKAANPSAGIVMIDPPAASNTGNASLGFPLKLPAGRQGIQPDLTVRYNNEGGNSWLGLGWNLSIPAISIETRWGVPRYDAALETETYALAGEQLAPVAHREAFKPRTADKQFYPRVEGSFQKIIRHGDRPSNYWWEVTDKTGTRSFYGGKPNTGISNDAVLRDANNNIAHWALTQTTDANDNSVLYFYEKVTDPGIEGGTVPGQQIYVREINYTGSGSAFGPYTIWFDRDSHLGEPRRKDVDINARLGFKMVSTDRLRQVRITFEKQPVRRYELQYQEGAFYKTLLKNISELDAAGTLFYTHEFSYYDDVNASGGYTPLRNSENWSPAFDNIRGDISNPIPGFGNESSALSTAKSSNSNQSLALTLGFWNGRFDKSLTVGGSVSSGSAKTEGLVTLADINGDGLPDKIFRQGGRLWYRANLGVAGQGFGAQKLVSGINLFSAGRSKSSGRGLEVNAQVSFGSAGIGAFWGNNRTNTSTTTTDYFSDFNGDGLIDLASNGRVYFNRINANGDPVFLEGSAGTPSPVFSGSNVSPTFLEPDTALQSQQERDFPLHDIVRTWQAPFSGTVSITAPVQLVNTSAGSNKKDGVRVSIQQSGTVRWSTTIAANDFSVKNPTGVNNLAVTKGQRIYFRMQSVYNGEEDLVNWDPVIQYTTAVAPAIDANARTTSRYQASQDIIFHNRQGSKLVKDGTIRIDGNFSKGITSDTVRLSIIRETNGIPSIVLQQSFACSTIINQPVIIPSLAVAEDDQLRFELYSDSYIDRSVLQWEPHFEYTAFTDATPVTNNNGRPTVEEYVPPVNTNYNDWLIATPLLTTPSADTFSVKPFLSGPAAANGEITLTIKTRNNIIGKRRLQLVNGSISSMPDSIRVISKAGEEFYCEYHSSDRNLALALTTVAYIRSKDTILIDPLGNPVAAVKRDTLNAGLFTQPAEDFLGTLYRGWGHFAFRGIKGNNDPLDESRINTNGLTNYSNDPNLFTDSSLFNGILDVSQTDFIPLYADIQRKIWRGFDSSVYVSATQMSSARLWMHDVSVDSLMTGGNVTVVNKIVTTKARTTSMGLNVSADFVGGGANKIVSEASTVNDLDMQDLNGDRYPDVLHLNKVQFTLPTGGLQSNTTTHNLGASNFEGNSKGHSLGGSGNLPNASAKNTSPENASAQAQQAEGTIGIAINGSASVSENNDAVVTSWMDINGDGLLDKLYRNGTAALNLGYTFAPAENWGVPNIENNKTDEKGVSAGFSLGFSRVNGSFQAGASLQRSLGSASVSMADVNGDGLLDKLFSTGSQLTVQLNKGNGFAPLMPWNGATSARKNTGTGESFNSAFTITIPIFLLFVNLKICINPAFSNSDGISRETYQLGDVDGDGFADVLQSNNDGNLTVQRSTIGRTNMLRSVKRPMSSSFTLDYERLGNTYAMPQSKWVLKTTELADGVAGDGVDITRTDYIYSGGNYDRHEREFYGFSRVETQQLNTANGNIVYRSSIREFLNSTYYNKGLATKEWLQDAAGKRFTETQNDYQFRAVIDSAQFPALVKTTKLFYEGAPVAGISTYTEFDYDSYGNITRINDRGDGSQQDALMAVIKYHDLNTSYIKSVPSEIVVNTVAGTIRRRATTINSRGDITQIRLHISADSTAVYDLEYDPYGNLARITRPANYKQQRLWYIYQYDTSAHTYVTRVEDGYGYSSSSEYDLRFGEVTKSRSMTNDSTTYQFDNRGRAIIIRGPYEIAAGKPYTIAFEYYPAATVPYAITHHYDPEHNAPINTITFMDGLGRAVQVKKQAAIFRAKNQPSDIRMIVSGKTIYDAFGRIIKAYYPTTENIGTGNTVLATGLGNIMQTDSFDVLDRTLSTTLADGAQSRNIYTIAGGFFTTTATDPLSNKKEILTDVKGRNREVNILGGPGGTITTRFQYNAMSELLRAVDVANNATSYTYDWLGRKLSIDHPDAGLTTLQYDAAGNLLAKITPQIRKEIPQGGAIKYYYDHERVTDIDYPRQYQNKVKYVYGKPGTGNRTGRLILQMDASGGQEFYYGRLGEITKTIRTMVVSNVFYTTYVSEEEYDTWNRIKKMVYADGEVVKYHYNRGGSLDSVTGYKAGNNYTYVKQVGYDEYEQRVYLQYGNGTDNSYTYENQRRRLKNLQSATKSGRLFMNNRYDYDAVNNITSITNDVLPQAGTLGGSSLHSYSYDNLYRLTGANATYKGAADSSYYRLAMQYDNLYNIVSKQMVLPQANKSYSNTYSYAGASPHQPSSIGASNCKYDLNGNLLSFNNQQNFWDEENRLMAVIGDGKLSQYTYDADGDRAIKSSGGIRGSWINGAPAGVVNHDTNYTAYVSPYLVCRRTGFTKHFYIEGQRITSKIGIGRFTNISFPQAAITAGGINYLQRIAQIQRDRYAYYRSLGISPGPPTDKYYYALPYNNGIAAPITYDTTSNTVPAGWPGNTTPPGAGGPPIFVSPIPSNDSVKAGYGFVGTGFFHEQQQYYYHPDHLGSTGFVSNVFGEVCQHQEYAAFGETFVDEHSTDDKMPYLFNGKEKDAETGLYYYGARYYDPKTSIWLSVDPMAEKYPGLSPYNYTLLNPVKLNDPDGRSPIYDPDGTLLGVSNKGLQGVAIVMSQDKFEQGMPHEEALKNDLRVKGLKDAAAKEKFHNSYNNLYQRPDFDGKLTKSEADEWWKSKSGEPLFVDQSKIELPGVTTKSFDNKDGKSFYKNFVWGLSNTGKVYGTLKLTLKSSTTGAVHIGGAKFLDEYDYRMDSRGLRNFATWVGRPGGADNGKSFFIYGYGQSKVKVIK